MTGSDIALYATGICLLIGATFSVIGAAGLLKFDNAMSRMHAPTKVGTMGLGALLLGSVIHAEVLGHGAIHAVLIMVFMFVTAPISAHFIAKVAIHRRRCVTPPPPPRDETWATLDVPDEAKH